MEKFIDGQVKLVGDFVRLGLADAQFAADLSKRVFSEAVSNVGNANKAAASASSAVSDAKDYWSSRVLKVSSLMRDAQNQAQDASRIITDYTKGFTLGTKK